ncbi:MAG: glycerol-3-phosphate 1-O-acyltransferase PlsY [Puniceicoccaceae bacterium]
MPTSAIIIFSLVGYLLGSISFAVIYGRAKGIDVLKVGSGNPGSTNVKRVLGPTAGNVVFILDFLKGTLSAGLPLALCDHLFGVSPSETYAIAIIGGVAAIFGHSFSIFLRFRGGKGVAVTMGALLVLMPGSLITGLLIWYLTYRLTGYVSLASIFFALSLPFSAASLPFAVPPAGQTFAILIAILITFRHRSNIIRLIEGTEHRFKRDGSSEKNSENVQ